MRARHRRPGCTERCLVCVQAVHRVALYRHIAMSSNVHAAEVGDTALSDCNLDRGPAQQGESPWRLLPRDRIVALCVGRDALAVSQDHYEGDERISRAAHSKDLRTFRGDKLIPPVDHGRR